MLINCCFNVFCILLCVFGGVVVGGLFVSVVELVRVVVGGCLGVLIDLGFDFFVLLVVVVGFVLVRGCWVSFVLCCRYLSWGIVLWFIKWIDYFGSVLLGCFLIGCFVVVMLEYRVVRVGWFILVSVIVDWVGLVLRRVVLFCRSFNEGRGF